MRAPDPPTPPAPRPRRGGRPQAPTRTRLEAQLCTLLPGLQTLPGRRASRTVDEYTDDGLRYLRHCQQHALPPHAPPAQRHRRQAMVDGTTLSPNTINRRLNAVKALVKATAALGHLDTGLAYEFSLVEKCKVATLRTRLNPHTRRLLTPAQVRALCLAPNPSTFSGLRDRALLYTLASSGCRISELATLQRTHIVPLGPSWGLTVLGKGQATERLAPLAPDAYHWIQRWLAKRDAVLTSAWVFTACDYGRPDHPVGHPLTPQTIGSRVKRYARQIGLPHISAHHLRKFCGTQIAQKFGPRQGQKALGHKLFATFETYYLLDQLEGGLSDDLF